MPIQLEELIARVWNFAAYTLLTLVFGAACAAIYHLWSST